MWYGLKTGQGYWYWGGHLCGDCFENADAVREITARALAYNRNAGVAELDSIVDWTTWHEFDPEQEGEYFTCNLCYLEVEPDFGDFDDVEPADEELFEVPDQDRNVNADGEILVVDDPVVWDPAHDPRVRDRQIRYFQNIPAIDGGPQPPVQPRRPRVAAQPADANQWIIDWAANNFNFGNN